MALFTSTSCTDRHHQVAAQHTRPQTMSKRLGCNHQAHGKTPYSGPSADEKKCQTTSDTQIYVELAQGGSRHQDLKK